MGQTYLVRATVTNQNGEHTTDTPFYALGDEDAKEAGRVYKRVMEANYRGHVRVRVLDLTIGWFDGQAFSTGSTRELLDTDQALWSNPDQDLL